MPKREDCKTAPSGMFLDSMAEGGVTSDHLTCEFCQREHLCPDTSYGMVQSDLFGPMKEHYEELAKNDPLLYILHYDCDEIIGRYIDDRLYVLDCPCNSVYRYENFIWEHKGTILKYLERRAIQEGEWNEQQLTYNKLQKEMTGAR